jgi:hypothetical protein
MTRPNGPLSFDWPRGEPFNCRGAFLFLDVKIAKRTETPQRRNPKD